MNYPPHFVNVHKTAFRIALDFITPPQNCQHAMSLGNPQILRMRCMLTALWLQNAEKRGLYKFYLVHENASTSN